MVLAGQGVRFFFPQCLDDVDGFFGRDNAVCVQSFQGCFGRGDERKFGCAVNIERQHRVFEVQPTFSGAYTQARGSRSSCSRAYIGHQFFPDHHTAAVS